MTKAKKWNRFTCRALSTLTQKSSSSPSNDRNRWKSHANYMLCSDDRNGVRLLLSLLWLQVPLCSSSGWQCSHLPHNNNHTNYLRLNFQTFFATRLSGVWVFSSPLERTLYCSCDLTDTLTADLTVVLNSQLNMYVLAQLDISSAY